jgi:hypothetical protein
MVRDNARVCGEAWALERADGDVEVCGLEVIGEDPHVGGRSIVCGEEIRWRRGVEAGETVPGGWSGECREKGCGADALEGGGCIS